MLNSSSGGLVLIATALQLFSGPSIPTGARASGAYQVPGYESYDARYQVWFNWVGQLETILQAVLWGKKKYVNSSSAPLHPIYYGNFLILRYLPSRIQP